MNLLKSQTTTKKKIPNKKNEKPQNRNCSSLKSNNNKIYQQNNNKPSNDSLNSKKIEQSKIRSESNFGRRRSNNIEKPSNGKYVNGTIGLINIGNTCYLNSAIQNLKNVHLLIKHLLLNHKNYIPNSFTLKYCELITNLINQDTQKYYIINIIIKE